MFRYSYTGIITVTNLYSQVVGYLANQLATLDALQDYKVAMVIFVS